MVLRVFCIELFGDFLGGAFTRCGVDVHCGGYVGVTEGVLQVLWGYVFLDGYRSVAVAELVGGGGNANVALIIFVKTRIAVLVQRCFSAVVAEYIMIRL